MAEADLRPLTDEQRRMVESVIPMIHHFYRRSGLYLNENQFDDFLSLCYEKLCQATKSFDPAQGKWTTFAGTCILRHMKELATMARMDISRREIRTLRQVQAGEATEGSKRCAQMIRGKVSLDQKAPENFSILEYTASDAPNPEQIAMHKEVKRLIEKALELRSERERHIFISHVEGEALAQIAVRLGISRERVRQINNAVKARILAELEVD